MAGRHERWDSGEGVHKDREDEERREEVEEDEDDTTLRTLEISRHGGKKGEGRQQ